MTRLIAAAAQKFREIFGSRNTVAVSAPAWVAAGNVGRGGRALASLFRTVGDALPEALKGDIGAEFGRELQGRRLLIMGEISTLDAQQLAAISERLRQRAAKVRSSGWVVVVFPGDFAQISQSANGLLYTETNLVRATGARNRRLRFFSAFPVEGGFPR